MKQRLQHVVQHGLFILTAALTWSLLWFIPIVQATHQQGYGWFESVHEVFFLQKMPELLVGKGVDLYGSFWMVEQVKNMLLFGQPTTMDTLYYPIGFNLGENTGYAWVDAALGVPIAMWLGTPGFWNLHVLCVCTLSIAALIVLFRQFDLSYWYAIPLAYLCYTNPFMIDELNLGRPTQISIWPMALLMAIFVRIPIHGFVWWHGVLAGICMALSCLTYWFTAIAIGVCVLILYLFEFLRSPKKQQGVWFGLCSIFSALIIVLPITWPMTSRLLNGRMQHSYRKLLGKPDHIYSWASLELQTEYSISGWSDLVYVFKASCQFIPFFLVIVVCSCLRQGRVEKGLWVVLWIFTLGMSLSSGINLYGVHVPTGLAILEWIFPPMLRCQFEGRNVVVANLIGFVIVAYSVRAFILENPHRNIQRWTRWIGSILLLYAMTLLPSSKTLATTQFKPRIESNRLFRENPGAILEFPYMASNYTYVQQIYHGQPLFGGMGFDTVRPIEHKRYAVLQPAIQIIEDV